MFTLIFLIKARPFKDNLLNVLEFVNELCLYLACYPVLFFTPDLVTNLDTDKSYLIGWALILIIAVNVAINIFTMIVVSFFVARTKCRKWR